MKYKITITELNDNDMLFLADHMNNEKNKADHVYHSNDSCLEFACLELLENQVEKDLFQFLQKASNVEIEINTHTNNHSSDDFVYQNNIKA